jgi:flagellar basal body-associated protein FliL
MVERSILEGKPFRVLTAREDSIEKLSISLAVAVSQADARRFDTLYAECSDLMHDCIKAILDATSTQGRVEPGLTSLKAKLKSGINDVLGAPLVLEVFVVDYTLELSN